jgi:cytochrome c oxidase assembly protein Cox11
MSVTISPNNIHRPAPRWFRKTKKALTLLSDTACVMLLALGHADNSLLMLICRIGISGVLQSVEALLANGEEYVNVEDIPVQYKAQQ